MAISAFRRITMIVNALAESDPRDYEYGECYFCDSDSEHTKDCPITLAKTLLAANVVPKNRRNKVV